MKKALTIAIVFILVGALALPAFAHGKYWGRGHYQKGYGQVGPDSRCQYDRGSTTLTEEQRDQMHKLHQEFRDQNNQLRNEIRSKADALNSVLNSAKPDAEKAKSLQQEISNLRAKMDQNRLDFELEARKIGPEIPLGRGYTGAHRPPISGHSRGGCWN